MGVSAFTENDAKARDAGDPVPSLRERFLLPRDAQGETLVYFCGNSLGPQVRDVRADLEVELSAWEQLAVEGHFGRERAWYSYHEDFAAPMADVVGARPSEVVVMNSLTVNLHLLMASFYRPDARRRKILIEDGAFPSDTYAVKSQLRHRGVDETDGLVLVRPRHGEATLRTDDVVGAIEEAGDELALVMLPGVHFFTGQALDLATITEAGHRVGAKVGWDLAHAAGNLQLHLHEDGPDFAAWCTYKYLNAGPGAVAGAFVHERHGRDVSLPRLAGWWGNDPKTRFRMHLEPEFVPQPGAAGWQLSNPPILAMAPLRASLAAHLDAGMGALRARSERMSAYLIEALDELHGERVEIITPRDPAQRGCQVSLRVQGASHDLFGALRARGVVGDFRPPDVIRVAPAPLYNTYHEIWRFVTILKDLVEEQQ